MPTLLKTRYCGKKGGGDCFDLPGPQRSLLSPSLKHSLKVTNNLQGHALLSRLAPGTQVARHHGISNCQLTMHLGLLVPPSAGIEVNGRVGEWREGRVLVFDDSYPHSVWHNGSAGGGPRLVLLLRGYHPEWTLEERARFVLTHPETPWTPQQRAAEVDRLLGPGSRDKWAADRRRFRGLGPGLEPTFTGEHAPVHGQEL
jgi:hypothetical protein